MFAWEYPPRVIGGLARVVGALSKELVNLGMEVHVVTADHPGTREYDLDGGVHIHRVKTQTDPAPDFMSWINQLNFGMLQYAIPLHQKVKFDVVHAHDWMVTDATRVMKSGFGIPVVTTMHATEQGRMGGIHNDQQKFVSQFEWRLCFESWRIIVNSHHMTHELKSQFNIPDDKIRMIPNGTNPEEFELDFDAAPLRNSYAYEHQKIILYVGRLVNEKGVQVLLEAAPTVLQNYPGTQFLIVGTGYFMEELQAKAQHLGVHHNVRFLGYVSDDDLLQHYKIADVVAIPSLYEPFGIVALEAMAARIPAVVSDTGGLRDFVQHMETGITTYTGNAQSLAWGLLEVLRNPQLAEKIKEQGYESVEKVYNWKVIAKKTEAVYQEVLDLNRDKQKVEAVKV